MKSDCQCDHNSIAGIFWKREVGSQLSKGRQWYSSEITKWEDWCGSPTNSTTAYCVDENAGRKPGFTDTILCQIPLISFLVGLLYGLIMYSLICSFAHSSNRQELRKCSTNYAPGTVLAMKTEIQASRRREKVHDIQMLSTYVLENKFFHFKLFILPNTMQKRHLYFIPGPHTSVPPSPCFWWGMDFGAWEGWGLGVRPDWHGWGEGRFRGGGAGTVRQPKCIKPEAACVFHTCSCQQGPSIILNKRCARPLGFTWKWNGPRIKFSDSPLKLQWSNAFAS